MAFFEKGRFMNEIVTEAISGNNQYVENVGKIFLERPKLSIAKIAQFQSYAKGDKS